MLDRINAIEEVEVDDDEALQIIAETRHKQMLQSSAAITKAVGQVEGEIKNQSSSIAKFAETIKGLALSKTQFDALSLLTKELISEQKKTGEKMDTLIALQSEKHEWDFTINRDSRTEKTTSITAKQIK